MSYKSLSYYKAGYHSSIHSNLIDSDEYFYERAVAQSRLYFSPEELGNSDLRVLEFGAGIGQGIFLFPNAIGFDPSPEAITAMHARNIRCTDDLSSIPSAYFDIVLSRHSLEHVLNPLESLQAMRSFLGPGGKLILVIPRERHYTCPTRPDKNMHLYSWNLRTINNLLHVAGYKVCSNKEIYVLGYRKLLLVSRFSRRLYWFLVSLVGRFYRNGEFLITAQVV